MCIHVYVVYVCVYLEPSLTSGTFFYREEGLLLGLELTEWLEKLSRKSPGILPLQLSQGGDYTHTAAAHPDFHISAGIQTQVLMYVQ